MAILAAGTGSSAASAAPGFTNRLINSSGRIWQRLNTGAAAVTDVTYAFDRWYGLTQTAGVTASQQTNVENTTPYMMRLLQANAAAQRFGIAQVIESANCIDLRGQTVVLSARVRMSASTTLRYAIIEWTGTADTVTKDFVLDWTNATFTAGQFFTTTTTTITATGSTALTANTLASISLSGTLGSSATNVAVIFWTDSTQAQNVTLDIGKAQLEIGTTATTAAVTSAQNEMLFCQRYYETTYDLGTAIGAATSTGCDQFGIVAAGNVTGAQKGYSYKVSKFKAPTVTTYSTNTGVSGKAYDVSANADVNANVSSIGFNGLRWFVTIAASTTGSVLIHLVMDAEI